VAAESRESKPQYSNACRCSFSELAPIEISRNLDRLVRLQSRPSRPPSDPAFPHEVRRRSAGLRPTRLLVRERLFRIQHTGASASLVSFFAVFIGNGYYGQWWVGQHDHVALCKNPHGFVTKDGKNAIKTTAKQTSISSFR
jgi:hypothetical protein